MRMRGARRREQTPQTRHTSLLTLLQEMAGLQQQLV